jgi:hypothetical protein
MRQDDGSEIDRLLPGFDFAERHGTEVDAAPGVVDACVRALDLSGSRVVRTLYRLRGMPASSLRIEGLERIGFRILVHEPGQVLALGLIGRFWTLRGGLCRFDAPDFAGFDEPGWAKALWSFHMTPLHGGRTRLETETRIRCTDDESRRRFRAYWVMIRPFSGLIRRIALREVKRQAENAARATKREVAGSRSDAPNRG